MIDPNQPDYSNHPSASTRRGWSYQSLLQSSSPVVSILTPFYNTGDVFLQTLHSILGQSLQEWEWIIVDDGSTDAEALALLAQAPSKDKRIRVVRQQTNQGPSAARNRAFVEASGRYLCLLDSDDLLEPTYLEKAAWFLESQPSFAFCNSWVVCFGEIEFFSNLGFEQGKEFIQANSVTLMSVIRRDAFAGVGGFEEDIRFGHEDWDFWLRMANAGHWGHTLPEYMQWYRRSNSGRHAQILAAKDAHNGFVRQIKEKYAQLARRFPRPQLRTLQPFETLPTGLPFRNLLTKPDGCKRMLVLIPWMVIGGADRVNLDWIRKLSERGYQISVCATLRADHKWLPEFAALTSDVFVLPNFLHPSDIPRFLVYLIQSRQIDTLLISNSTLGYQLLPYLRSFCPMVNYVDLCHVEEPHWLNGGHPRFAVGYQDMLDLNIVTTRNLRDWMTAHGACPERIEVCYSGVAKSASDEAGVPKQAVRARLGIPKDTPLLIFGGRLCPQKRPEVLVDVLRELVRQKIPFHCVLVGDGELRHALEKRLRRSGIEGFVTMVGAIPHPQWLQMLSASDILLMPSMYEGISVALYEAIALGVVPVISEVGGQAELVSPDCGALIPLGDGEIAAYAAVLRHLIENPVKRQAMSEASRQRSVQHFTLDRTIDKLMAILDRARDLAHTEPRQRLPTGIAQELATSAIEYSRLTTPRPISTALARVLAFIRSYKHGRAILHAKPVRVTGQWLLGHIRSWRD
jgi:glycosyltransferase involved in cell wall biosynthesis